MLTPVGLYVAIGLVYTHIHVNLHLLNIFKLRKLKIMTRKDFLFKKKLFFYYLLSLLTANSPLILLLILTIIFGKSAQVVTTVQAPFLFTSSLLVPIALLYSKINTVFSGKETKQFTLFLTAFLLLFTAFVGTRNTVLNSVHFTVNSDGTVDKHPGFENHRIQTNWVFFSLGLVLIIFYLFWNFFRDEGRGFVKKLLNDSALQDFQDLPKPLYSRHQVGNLEGLISHYRARAEEDLKNKEAEKEIKRKLKLRYGEKDRKLNIYFKFVWNVRLLVNILRFRKEDSIFMLTLKRRIHYAKLTRSSAINGSYMRELVTTKPKPKKKPKTHSTENQPLGSASNPTPTSKTQSDSLTDTQSKLRQLNPNLLPPPTRSREISFTCTSSSDSDNHQNNAMESENLTTEYSNLLSTNRRGSNFGNTTFSASFTERRQHSMLINQLSFIRRKSKQLSQSELVSLQVGFDDQKSSPKNRHNKNHTKEVIHSQMKTPGEAQGGETGGVHFKSKDTGQGVSGWKKAKENIMIDDSTKKPKRTMKQILESKFNIDERNETDAKNTHKSP